MERSDGRLAGAAHRVWLGVVILGDGVYMSDGRIAGAAHRVWLGVVVGLGVVVVIGVVVIVIVGVGGVRARRLNRPRHLRRNCSIWFSRGSFVVGVFGKVVVLVLTGVVREVGGVVVSGGGR